MEKMPGNSSHDGGPVSRAVNEKTLQVIRSSTVIGLPDPGL